MTTSIDICNRSLAAVPTRSNIASLQEKSPEARICNLFYQTTLDSMLRAAHWDFARKTLQLTILKAAYGTPENTGSSTTGQWDASQPSPPWLYSYAYPSDCILFRYVVPQIFSTGVASAGAVPMFSVPLSGPRPPNISIRPAKFVKATDTDSHGNAVTCLLSNQDLAIGIYTSRVTNPDLWDSDFEDAMVAALATRISPGLSGDKQTRQFLKQEALSAVMTAQVHNGNEGLSNVNVIPDWIRVRGYSGDWGTPGGDFSGSWSTPSFLNN